MYPNDLLMDFRSIEEAGGRKCPVCPRAKSKMQKKKKVLAGVVLCVCVQGGGGE